MNCTHSTRALPVERENERTEKFRDEGIQSDELLLSLSLPLSLSLSLSFPLYLSLSLSLSFSLSFSLSLFLSLSFPLFRRSFNFPLSSFSRVEHHAEKKITGDEKEKFASLTIPHLFGVVFVPVCHRLKPSLIHRSPLFPLLCPIFRFRPAVVPTSVALHHRCVLSCLPRATLLNSTTSPRYQRA